MNIESTLYHITKVFFFIVLGNLIANIWWQSYSTNKRCKKGKFTDWQRNLEPWQDVIAGYNTNILDVIKNRQQIERNTKERIVSKSNNIDVMTITATDTCNSITTRDYFHLKNCSNIGCISFTIKMNDGVKYAYMICHNSFSKAVVDYGTMFRVDTLVEFSSSKELFLDFEKQKILELFS
jgi:hypothetical protein